MPAANAAAGRTRMSRTGLTVEEVRGPCEDSQGGLVEV